MYFLCHYIIYVYTIYVSHITTFSNTRTYINYNFSRDFEASALEFEQIKNALLLNIDWIN